MNLALMFLFVLLSEAPSPAPQVADQKIESVEVRGNRRIPLETIRYYLQTKPGDVLRMDVIRRDIKELYAQRFFDDIRVDAEDGKNGGIVSPKGPAGSMILFHGCLVHASGSNLSPWDRVSVYLSLCAVSNHIRRFKRPEYIAHRDFTPIACLPDDCLLKDYPVDLPWKDGMPPSALETSTDELKLAA